MALRIVAVDDHPAIIMGLKALLERDNFAELIECPDFRQVSAIIEKREPDLVLIDMHMPRFDLERDFRLMRKRNPEEIFVAYTADEDPAVIARCRSLGFSGYILKSADFNVTRRRIEAILAGQKIFPDAPDSAGQLSPFSDSQIDVLRLMASGHKNREIAEILGVRDVTIDYHKRKIKDTLAAKSSAESVAIAKANGWI